MFKHLSPLLLVGLCLLFFTSLGRAQEVKDEAKKTPEEIAAKKHIEEMEDPKIKADSAWMMVSTAFVMLMVPGLALFYGGMVRRKNILAGVRKTD